MRKTLFVTTMLVAGLCTNAPMASGTKPVKKTPCGAEKFVEYEGQHLSVLKDVELPKKHRVVGNGRPATRDRDRFRLNIWVEQDDMIKEFNCG